MRDAFADTSYYVALLSSWDSRHELAAALFAGYPGGVVTTAFVLIETANFFRRAADRGVFLKLIAELRSDPTTEIIPATDDLYDRGLVLFADRPDKDWSLTDGISFAVMTDRGLTDALTADGHFEEAGFRALLV